MQDNCFIFLLLGALSGVLLSGIGFAGAETLIGCLFSPSVCAPGKEWCYDDMAFGRCLSVDEAISPEDLRQYNLEADNLASLESEMERLYSLGYRWDQLYTQCVLQALLRRIASGASPPYDRGGCDESFPDDVKTLSFMDPVDTDDDSDNLVDDNGIAISLPVDPSSSIFTEGTSSPARTMNLPAGNTRNSERMNRLKLLSNILDDPRHLASVRFTPSALNPNTKFADEVYLPPSEELDSGESVVVRPTKEELRKIASVVLGPDGKQAPRKDGLRMQLLKQELLNEAGGINRDDVSTVEDLLRFAAGIGTAMEPDYRLDDVNQDDVENNNQQQSLLDDDLMNAMTSGDTMGRVQKRVFGIERNVAEKKNKKEGKKRKKGKKRRNKEAKLAEQEAALNIKAGDVKDYDMLGDVSESMENDLNYFDFVGEDGREMTRARKDDSERKGNFNNFFRDVLVGSNGEELVVDPHSAIDLASLWQPRRLQEDDSGIDEDDMTLEGPGGVGASQDLVGEESSAAGALEPMYADSRYEGSRDFFLPDGGVLDLSLAGKDLFSPLDDEGDFEMPLAQNSVEDGPYQRLERMDVKKPGPEFDSRIPPDPPKHHHQQPAPVVEDGISNDLHLTAEGSQLHERIVPGKHELLLQEHAKGLAKGQESEDKTKHHISAKSPEKTYFRKDYAYLQITKQFASKQEGKKVVTSLERLLGLEPGTFTDVRVEGNQVMFKVNPNPQRLNVTDVINGAEQYKEAMKNDVAAEIESGGIGDEIKIAWKDYRATQKEKILLISLSAVAAVAASMAAGLMIYLVRRYYKRRSKLYNLTKGGDTEASRDYQDLCRARMATKAQEKAEPLHKIITGSIVKEDQSQQAAVTGSPHSSRSSTSSWTEEPVASNMDISTGHMVLSYMEDHLKNKDKLEQEWLALCAYEADPCSTNIAHRAENQKKNRDKTTVPYDHARVVLNDLSNISGSDYINASTITDHDPRNPAYIACQGPMAGTAADFWQMVWEQGSVVIVMLTKLAENGTAMCHRYWPEEGSEVYHIYEVHLVSEHIWCEDYLVRSFYLKNLKTGETRTVTQFHFLSWPVDGVPNSTRALLEFRRKVNKSYRGRSCPIIVHCNDGSGRTGTYILIDMVLNRMAKGAKEIDIAATLEHIRDQRPGTVKTRTQFEFVLMAVAEEVHAILKAMPQ